MLLLLAMLVALAAPASSLAQNGHEVIRDCAEDGDLDGNYSQDELDAAYENMPSDIDEYSDCRDVIERAREPGGGGANNAAGSPATVGGQSGPGGGDGAAATGGSRNDAEELQSRTDRSHADDAPRATIAGEQAGTDGGTIATSDESDGMPAPLIVALILAALAALAGALYLLRDHLPPGIASRLPGPLGPDSQG
jgi:hypothetical protein